MTTTGGLTTVTIVAGAITIDDLGQNGSAGTALIPGGWSLVLDATDGSIVFLNLGDTIATQGTGTITVEAGTSTTDVAALGNLTTGGGNITVSAGGNVAVGTLTAGRTGSLGTVSVTSANGNILFSNATTPTVTASSTTLTLAAQPASSPESVALAQLHAAEVIAAADAASARHSRRRPRPAQAAAELASVNAFQAALTSIQAAVTTANQTYQADVQITNQESNMVNADTNTVNALTNSVTIADGIAGAVGLVGAVFAEIAAVEGLASAATYQIPVVGTFTAEANAAVNLVAATLGLVSASASAAAQRDQVDLNNASTTLGNDSATLALDQTAEAQAAAQLQADMDTETALTAAYDVANQAYTSSEQAYTSDQTTSAQVQAEGDTAQAIAIANVVFAAPSQPITSTATGTGPVNIDAQSPLTQSANITAVAAINLTAQTDWPANTPGDDLTVNSGVIVQSTGSSVTLFAGDNVVIESGSTIEAVLPRSRSPPTATTIRVARP